MALSLPTIDSCYFFKYLLIIEDFVFFKKKKPCNWDITHHGLHISQHAMSVSAYPNTIKNGENRLGSRPCIRQSAYFRRMFLLLLNNRHSSITNLWLLHVTQCPLLLIKSEYESGNSLKVLLGMGGNALWDVENVQGIILIWTGPWYY